ncbi:zinc finger protein 567-like [Trematomus bernacchii]|uniref:zinc finger protein 567-like n=1 Tax=Trematomus bernacchii TaxID=40690 RepID=UPI00146B7660|nr:zinc finger protein 567-like [Trematomus bernacchii]
MEGPVSEGSPPLPLSTLRLLVPPVRLLSAAIWQTLQHKTVADYGMLEEFVSMVTDIIPELLSTHQRTQLLLGLRAQLVLGLCHYEATADLELVQPHLDRVQMLMEAWPMDAGAANTVEPHATFVDLIKSLLKNADEREHFYLKVFPEQFGPTYDDILQTLMWTFLSRLEQILPLQTFQQVASTFGDVSSVLGECMDSVSQCEGLQTLLQYHKDLSLLDHNDSSLEDARVISVLEIPASQRSETDEPQANILDNVALSDSTVSHTTQRKINATTEDRTRELKIDETNWTLGDNETDVLLGHFTRHEETVGLLQSQVEDGPLLLKRCSVLLERLDMPMQSRPVRRNRGKRLKTILLEEKRGLCKEAPPAYKSASRKTKPSDNMESGIFSNSLYMAPINHCSDDDSWSYYSDQDLGLKTPSSSLSEAGSWSNYSGEGSSFGTPVSRPIDGDSSSSCSNEDTSFIGPTNILSTSKNQGTSDIKASITRKTRKVQCFICQELVNTSLRAHMKSHFPLGEYACPRCDSRFKLYSSFRQHFNRTCFEYGQQQFDLQKPEEAMNLYKCDKCEEPFRYKVSLNRHKHTHNELYCSVCRKVLRDAATLARHKASHTPFQCNRCEETFTLFKPLSRHCENIHKISRPFKCSYCPKVVSKLRVLITHEWKHTGHLPFQCAQCGLRYKTDGDLTSHQRVHTREKPYLCAECGKTFSQKSNLLRHLNLIHSESRNEKKYSCPECEKSFKEKGALKKHQRTKHLNELFRHPCPYCGKMVSSSTIARHKLIHTGERPFKCTVPECDKYFRSTPEVKKHVLIHHTTERPYKCDICGKGFIRRCFLNAHAKTHSGEKPFVCHICGKAFPKHYSMQRHKKLVHAFVTH